VLLAIDTSTSWISLALYDGVQVQYEITWQSRFHHTVELAPAISQVFDHTGTQTKDLTGIAIATGPGSFTSLRIGVAAAKGMALGLKLPLVGIPSLDVIAYAQPLDERPLIAILHAGRSRLAYVTYLVEGDQWCPQHEPAVLDAKDLVKTITAPTLIAGELSEEARSILGRRWKNAMIVQPARCLRRAGFLAEMGWVRLLDNQVDDPVTLTPIYLNTTTPIPE
jgi:tRNA threonylcarbamoyladenosine biosynthesis protein TsaB